MHNQIWYFFLSLLTDSPQGWMMPPKHPPTTLSGKHKNRNKHDSHNLKCVRILQLSQQTIPFSLIDMDWSKEIKGIPDR